MSSLCKTKTQQDRQTKRRMTIGCERDAEGSISSFLSYEMTNTSLFELSSSSLGSCIADDDDDHHHHNFVGRAHVVVARCGRRRRFSWSNNCSFSIQDANDIFEREVQKQSHEARHQKHNVYDDLDKSEVATTRPPMVVPGCDKRKQVDKCQSKKKKKKKTVRFSKIAEIRNYPIVVGDNPSVWNGPPLSIGWQWISIDITKIPPCSPIDSFFRPMSIPPRRRSNQERIELLRRLGYGRGEIQFATIQATTIRNQREMTREETKLSRLIQDHWQRAYRKISDLVTFGRRKRKERSYLKHSGCVQQQQQQQRERQRRRRRRSGRDTLYR